jgi:hypothetical protein
MRRWPWLILVAALALSGCKVGQTPNPNDPLTGGDRAGDLLRIRMKATSDLVNERIAQGDINDAQGRLIIQTQAGDELDRLKDIPVPDDKAWEFAEVAITARRWEEAGALLNKALKYESAQLKQDPRAEDRWVNDTLRLAHTQAALGQIDKALATAREAFKASPHWKWPILYAVYLEIVPAAEEAKPGRELELAKFIEEGIAQHQAAEGDTSNPNEAGWVNARDFHIRAAWQAAANLYRKAGREDLAEAALRHADTTPHAVRA